MSIYLYAPEPALGGTESLALRLAQELLHRGRGTVLVTAPGGWLDQQAQAAGMRVIDPADFATYTLPKGARVIASSKYLRDAKMVRHLPVVIFWILHPLEFCWNDFKRVFGAYRFLDAANCGRVFRLVHRRRFMQLRDDMLALAASGHLLSMSEDCTAFTNRFLHTDIRLPLVMLPASEAARTQNSRGEPAVRTIAYFGRIEDFKVASICRLLSDVARLPDRERWGMVQLFGYGRQEAQVAAYAASLGVRINISGALPVHEVARRARDMGALVFTMGLSGVDLLAQGVPTVYLPIPTSDKDRRGTYAFLHKLPAGCLGSYPEFLDPAHGYQLSELLRLASTVGLSQALAADRDCVLHRHQLTTTVDDLLAHLGRTAAMLPSGRGWRSGAASPEAEDRQACRP